MVVAEVFVIENGEILWGGSFTFDIFIDSSGQKARLAFTNITQLINEIMKDAYEDLV